MGIEETYEYTITSGPRFGERVIVLRPSTAARYRMRPSTANH